VDIGLHIRLHRTITAVAQKARRLGLPYFQTFVLNSAGKFFQPCANDKKKFLALRSYFGPLFLHSSYWINCASSSSNVEYLLERELTLATDLGFDFYVIHPGAAHKQRPRKNIDLVARRLDHASKKYPQLTLLIENVAHASHTIGGDLCELGILARKLAHCSNIGFCIDTAHAYTYGYNLTTPPAIDRFLAIVHEELDCSRVRLIHLNNTLQACGSHLDTHTMIHRGNMSRTALIYFATHTLLQAPYIISELPPLPEKKEKAILKYIKQW
jgi:deoxyribonuclease-4